MSASAVRIPRPRVESVRRRAPEQISLNDYAVASGGAELIDLLQCIPGYELRYSIPFQLGATAADAVFAPDRNAGVNWAAYQIDVRWHSLPSPHRHLEARAQMEYSSPTRARFHVETHSGGLVIVLGKIHYFRVRNSAGATPPSQPEEGGHAPLEGRYSPDLLRLLMNPVAGGAEPLGRRIHPAGSVPLAAAIFQAKRRMPDRRIIAATMEYRKPFSTSRGFVAATRLAEDGRVVVTLADPGGILLEKSAFRFEN